MFELIGLASATLFLFVIAALAGCIFAFVVWLIVRQRRCARWKWATLAFAVPVISAAWLWLCIAFLPGESLFGDFSEKLPNHYLIEGLAKMPDYATIAKGDSDIALPQGIDSLEVTRQLVVGKYSHPFDLTSPTYRRPADHYFILDTQTDQHTDFETQAEMEKSLGHSTKLVPAESFKSSEPLAVLQRRIDRAIILVPPILLAVLYLGLALRLLRGELPPLSLLQT